MAVPPRLAAPRPSSHARPLAFATLRLAPLALLAAACSSVPPEGRARLELEVPAQAIALPSEAVARVTLHGDQYATVMLIKASGPIAFHRHFHSEEIVYLLAGSGTLHLAQGDREMRAGDLVVVPPNTPHGFTPGSDEPAVLLSTFVPPFQDGDRVPEPAR
ncbi:MAG: cupin domain-containing protein [Planctomycetes bacterium]|nr:cupin domain-containing protein [Planctomycetota bacterium]